MRNLPSPTTLTRRSVVGNHVVKSFVSALWLSFVGILFGGSYGALWLDASTVRSLAREDGFFEYSTAIAFLVACVVALTLFAKSTSGNNLFFFTTRRNIFYVLLAFLFFVIAGEELSWGQRIVGFDISESIRARNIQEEFNIHNLEFFDRRGAAASNDSTLLVFLTIQRMYSMFWLAYCFLIPIISRVMEPVAALTRSVNLPLAPVWLGVLFPINYLCSFFLLKGVPGGAGNLSRQVVEITEFVFSALFLALVCAWALDQRRRRLGR